MSRKAQRFVSELCDVIKGKFPEAEFEISQGIEDDGIYIWAHADIERAG